MIAPLSASTMGGPHTKYGYACLHGFSLVRRYNFTQISFMKNLFAPRQQDLYIALLPHHQNNEENRCGYLTIAYPHGNIRLFDILNVMMR